MASIFLSLLTAEYQYIFQGLPHHPAAIMSEAALTLFSISFVFAEINYKILCNIGYSFYICMYFVSRDYILYFSIFPLRFL